MAVCDLVRLPSCSAGAATSTSGHKREQQDAEGGLVQCFAPVSGSHRAQQQLLPQHRMSLVLLAVAYTPQLSQLLTETTGTMQHDVLGIWYRQNTEQSKKDVAHEQLHESRVSCLRASTVCI
jgi:hypothetical protein